MRSKYRVGTSADTLRLATVGETMITGIFLLLTLGVSFTVFGQETVPGNTYIPSVGEAYTENEVELFLPAMQASVEDIGTAERMENVQSDGKPILEVEMSLPVDYEYQHQGVTGSDLPSILDKSVISIMVRPFWRGSNSLRSDRLRK